MAQAYQGEQAAGGQGVTVETPTNTRGSASRPMASATPTGIIIVSSLKKRR